MINSGKLHVRVLKDGFLRTAPYQMSQDEIQIGQNIALSRSLILGASNLTPSQNQGLYLYHNLSYHYSFWCSHVVDVVGRLQIWRKHMRI
jgi:hypothetical protein